jgi:hypothetical protein
MFAQVDNKTSDPGTGRRAMPLNVAMNVVKRDGRAPQALALRREQVSPSVDCTLNQQQEQQQSASLILHVSAAVCRRTDKIRASVKQQLTTVNFMLKQTIFTFSRGEQ